MYVQGIAIFCAIYCTVDMFSCVYSVLYTIIVQLKDNKMHNFCITEFLHRFSTACPISFVQFLWYTHSYKWTRLLGHSVTHQINTPVAAASPGPGQNSPTAGWIRPWEAHWIASWMMSVEFAWVRNNDNDIRLSLVHYVLISQEHRKVICIIFNLRSRVFWRTFENYSTVNF